MYTESKANNRRFCLGARSYAALGILGLNVCYCVHIVVLFPSLLLGGADVFFVDLYFKFKDRFNYF